MRKKIIAANWKMNLNYAEAMALTDTLVDSGSGIEDMQVIIAAPFVYLHDLVSRIQSRPDFSIAAQNCSENEKGAFTGEISASMLSSIGVEHVIVGHSERRTYFGESDELIFKKISKVLEHGLIPIFCCGEDQELRKDGNHMKHVKGQLEKGLFQTNSSLISKCIVAYEPVWAIGTGVNATKEETQEMHAFIRMKIAEKYSEETASQVSIIYGGSVTPANSSELFGCPDVDGALVGGASLKFPEFNEIISSMNDLHKIKN